MNLRRRRHIAKKKLPYAISKAKVDATITSIERSFVARSLGAMIGSVVGEKLAADPAGMQHALMQIVEPALAERKTIVAWMRQQGLTEWAERVERGDHQR